ncbi:MAG: 50S ribosomal protein L25 [Pirellulales bacterium]
MDEVLDVELRQLHGKRRVRRLRKSGLLPAVVYGHGEESISVAVPEDALRHALRHGSQLIKLGGAVNSSVLIREPQWDSFGHEVLHVDFLRVDADQRIEVTVEVQLRGIAPGVKAGGVVDHVAHRIEIDVQASDIPEVLHVNVNELNLGESILASQIEGLPAGARLLTSDDAIIVQCVEPAEEKEEVEMAESIEPELIGGKPGEAAEEG